MPYFISIFSSSPRLCPFFEPIQEDESRGHPKLASGCIWGLDGGYRLTDSTEISIQSVYRRARLTSSHKVLPSIFHVSSEICVAKSVRADIESLEPGVHQFFPVTLFGRKGEIFQGEYFLLNICQITNSIVFEKSNLTRVELPNGAVSTTSPARSDDFRTVRADAVKGMHLWRELIYQPDMYISEELFDVFREKRYKGIDDHNYIVCS